MFGVAGGILLAGLIGFIVQAWFAVSLMEAVTEILSNNIKLMQQTANPQQTSTLNLGTYNPAITPIQNPP